jgi:hypothetical protein
MTQYEALVEAAARGFAEGLLRGVLRNDLDFGSRGRASDGGLDEPAPTSPYAQAYGSDLPPQAAGSTYDRSVPPGWGEDERETPDRGPVDPEAGYTWVESARHPSGGYYVPAGTEVAPSTDELQRLADELTGQTPEGYVDPQAPRDEPHTWQG